MFNSLITNNDKLFDSLFDNKDFTYVKKYVTEMATDIIEKDGVYTLSSNLAGFNKEDINVEYKQGYLTIMAEKSEKEEGNKENYYLKESKSKVSRSFFVGKDFSDEDFDAKFKDGILTVTFKKKEPKEMESKSIEIK